MYEITDPKEKVEREGEKSGTEPWGSRHLFGINREMLAKDTKKKKKKRNG